MLVSPANIILPPFPPHFNHCHWGGWRFASERRGLVPLESLPFAEECDMFIPCWFQAESLIAGFIHMYIRLFYLFPGDVLAKNTSTPKEKKAPVCPLARRGLGCMSPDPPPPHPPADGRSSGDEIHAWVLRLSKPQAGWF